MKSCPQCAHPLSTDDIQQCPECGFSLTLRAGDTLRDFPPQHSSSATVRNLTVREGVSPRDTIKLDSGDQDDDLFGGNNDSTRVENGDIAEGTTILVDPMHTMSRPSPEPDMNLTLPPPKQSQPSDSDQSKPGELAKTMIPHDEPTIVNPQAAQAAAEAYSQDLNTLIPPRTMVRKEESPENSDYQIEKKLGAGAFGVVFRATQTPLERSVAIKVLQNKSDDVAQQTRVKNEFLREAQFTGRLEHPNIVPIHDIGLTVSPTGNVNPFYVMKEIRGQSWHKEIRKQSLNDNLNIFKNVVNAIGFAHSQNILHCDLKPDNVMIGEFGEVLVVDWGQAVDLSNPVTMRPGGTPAYISPEMAQYWIDIYMDRKGESTSRKDVGPRSDIYLLGALLFEIVAGHPPHCRTANESPYEVIRRAAKNRIVQHKNDADQELMQIALSALRATDEPHIETIEALQAAIEDYENRSLSIDLRRRADELLDQAKRQSDYDNYQRARFGYEEAIQKWPNNDLAIAGLKDARLSCAQQALSDQNFDLGLDMLTGAAGTAESEVRDALTEGKRVRDRRKKWIAGLSIGLVGSILLGILINGYMIRRNLESIAQRDVAVVQKKEAIEDKARIENSIAPLRAEAKQSQAIIAEFPRKLAGEQRKFESEKENLEQKMDQEIATFNREKDSLVQQKKQLVGQNSQLIESSKLLRYKGKLNQVVENLQHGNFRETRKLLDDFENQNTFEIERLNLLAHREIHSLYPQQPLVSIAAAADGSRLAIAFDDRIELLDPMDLQQTIGLIPVRGADTIQFSPAGSTLAIGQPGDSPLTGGSVTLVDANTPLDKSKWQNFEAQSQSIDKLAFSQNGNVVLSLGKVSKLRQSTGSGLEEPLMAWEANGQRIEIDIVLSNGSKPKFDSATLSANGNRILLTNQSGLDRDQSAHVFQRSSTGYHWLATCPAVGISAAVFADDDASTVIASRRSIATGDDDLIRWTIREDANATNSKSQPRLSSIAPLPANVTGMDRRKNFLVTTGDDRQTVVWDLNSNQSRTLRGHTRPANVCFLRPGDSLDQCQITTAVTGASPEVFVTTLANYRQEHKQRSTGWTNKDQPASVTCIDLHESKNGSLEAYGNDQGMVSIISNSNTIQRNVSAWKSHVVCTPYVFAQSAMDHFYVFDRDSGALLKILTKIADARQGAQRVSSLEVSADGKTGLIQTDSSQPTFELWDLENESLIRTVNYGDQDLFGTGSKKQLTKFAISPDGRWVVGGKVGVFAWQVADGKLVRFKNGSATAARSNVNSITFVKQSNQFLVSWRKRIDRFDLLNPLETETFIASCVSDDQNRQNVFDAQLTAGGIQFLANNENANGINLVEFGNNRPIASFPNTSFASFQPTDPGKPITVVAAGDLTADDPKAVRWENGVTIQLNLGDVVNQVRARRVNKFERIYAAAGGKLLLQTTERDKEAVGRLWHSFSVEPQGQNASLSNLRVFAEPKIDAVATDGKRVGTLSDGTVRIWNLNDQSLQPAGTLNGEYSAIDLSSDGQQLVAASTQRLQVINFSTLQTIADLEMPPTVVSDQIAVAWRPDGSGFAVSFGEGTIVEFLATADGRFSGPGQKIQTINATPLPARIDRMVFSADANTLLVISAANATALVLHRQASANHQFVATLLAYDDGQSIVSADLSADGSRVAVGTAAGRIAIWNSEPPSKQAISAEAKTGVAERELLHMSNLHQSAISAIQFVERENQTGVLSAETESGQNEVLFWPAKD